LSIVRRDLTWEVKQALDSLPQSIREVFLTPIRDGLAVLLAVFAAILSVDNFVLICIALFASLGDIVAGSLYAMLQGEQARHNSRVTDPLSADLPADPVGRRVFQPAALRAGALKKMIIFLGVPLGAGIDTLVWRFGGVTAMLTYTPVMKFALAAYTLAEFLSWWRIIARAGGPNHLMVVVLKPALDKTARILRGSAGDRGGQ
jgi:hypothetical protein